MKKMLYILMILLGIGINAFGDWTVVNQTDEDLSNVKVCVSGFGGREDCQYLSIAKGQAGVIKTKPIMDEGDTGKLLGVAIKDQSLNLSDLKRARSGKFSIISIQRSCPEYALKLES